MQMLKKKVITFTYTHVITFTYTQKQTHMDTHEDGKKRILPSQRENDGFFPFSQK